MDRRSPAAHGEPGSTWGDGYAQIPGSGPSSRHARGLRRAGAPAPVPHVPERYGLDPEQPVEVCRPEGERRYLARLICPAGERPAFKRTGKVGPRAPPPPDMSPAEQERLLADRAEERRGGKEGVST